MGKAGGHPPGQRIEISIVSETLNRLFAIIVHTNGW